MYKLKIVQPKPLKVKFSVAFPPIILANLQEKTVVPLTNEVVVTADDSFDGLSKVTVGAIPSEYIIPSGELDITENGTYDVTNYVNANVNIPEKQLGIKTITSNGTYKASDDALDGYSEVDVNIVGSTYAPQFVSFYRSGVWDFTNLLTNIDFRNIIRTSYMFAENTITSGLDLSKIKTNNVTDFSRMFYNTKIYQSDVDFTQIDISNGINFEYMFGYFDTNYEDIAKSILNLNITNKASVLSYMFERFVETRTNFNLNINLSNWDVSNVTSVNNMFAYCNFNELDLSGWNPLKLKIMKNMFYYSKIKSIKLFDTSNITEFYQTFYSCTQLTELEEFDCSSATNVQSIIAQCSNLVTLGGFKDLGKNYDTAKNTNYSYYTLNLSNAKNLSVESLRNVINKLYDIASKGCKAQQFALGSTHLAKLTAEEIAVATNKGWTVS